MPHSMYVSVIHHSTNGVPLSPSLGPCCGWRCWKSLLLQQSVAIEVSSTLRVETTHYCCVKGGSLMIQLNKGNLNSEGRRLSLPYSSSESTGANSKALKPTRVHYNMFKQVLPKVIWEECVATPHGRECTCPLRVLLAVQCPLQTSPITWPRVR